MKTTKFKSTVTKGNDRGAGFIRLPLQLRPHFSVGDQYKIVLNSKIHYYSKIRDYSGKGVFIPAFINTKNSLAKKEVEVELEKIDGFYSVIGKDGRIYIPNSYNLKKSDMILVSILVSGKDIRSHHQVYLRERNKTKEFILYTSPTYSHNEAIVKIIKVFQRNKLIPHNRLFLDVLEEFDFAEVGENEIIVYYGNRLPILVRNDININDLAYYLGCYFADGTKRGVDWGICASTFEQANYYKRKHYQIIADPKIICSLSYTGYGLGNMSELRKKLALTWSKKTNNDVDSKKIRVVRTEIEHAPNRNPFGSLIMKEHRQLVQLYYCRLLSLLFKIITEDHNKKLATEFICGAMEGDGCVNSKTHGHVLITTNQNEIGVLKDICDKSFLKSSIRRWKGKPGRVDLLIGSLEIIKNLPFLKDKLFKYYPKRRRRLIERLLNTGTAKFIIGEQKSTSGWIKADLKNIKVLNENFKLTEKGRVIKNCLISLKKELK